MPQRSLNNFATSFLDAVSPSTTQFRIVRAAPGPLDLPLPAGDFFLLTAFRLVNGREVEHEVMRVNAVELTSTGAYTVTVQRAQEHIGSPTASTAYAYGVGDLLEARATAGTLDGMLQARDNLRTLADPDAALENLGAGVTGAAVLKAGNPAEARQILGVGAGGGGTVDVASNGALVSGGGVVAPAYLGPRDSTQIAAIHAAIEAGTANYPAGSTLVAAGGAVWTLQGAGTAARFAPGSPAEVKVQPIRSGNSSAVQADSGSVIPFSGASTFTLVSGLSALMVQLIRYDAAALNVAAGSGVVLWFNGERVNSVQVAAKGNWIVVMPGAAANEHFLAAVGTATTVPYTPPADTRPRWFNAPSTAASTGTQAFLDGANKFGANGGKAGTGITVTTTSGNYGWYACLASAGTPVFTHVSTGAVGGWVSQGNFTAGDGNVYQLWRQDYPDASPAGDVWTIA